MGFVAEPLPPKGFPLFLALGMASPDTIMLLIVDYHAAVGDKESRAPVAYALNFRQQVRSCIHCDLSTCVCCSGVPVTCQLGSVLYVVSGHCVYHGVRADLESHRSHDVGETWGQSGNS